MLTMLLALLMSLVGASPSWAQKALPYSYGFENNDLAAEGWTKYFGTSLTANNDECAINSAAKKTGNYGFRFSSYNKSGANAQYLISPEFNSSKPLTVSFEYAASSTSTSGETFKVGYSSTDTDVSSFTFGEEQSTSSMSWKTYKETFPAGTKYIAIYYYANYQYRLYIDDISVTAPIEGPALTVADGETKLSTGYNYGFGLVAAGATKTFTLSNPGTEACPVSVSHTGSFGAELSAASIPAGESVTLTVTVPEASGDDVITISSTAEGVNDFVINVSATVRDPNKLWCNFADGLPTGWTNSGNWSISNTGAPAETSGAGYAYNTSYGSNKLMYSPLVTIAEGEKLYLKAKGHGSTASWNVLKIQYSADGTNWTTAKDLTGITNSWQSIEVTEIPAGNWYIGFYGSYVYFTDIYGGTESTAPIIALSQNSYDFGLISANTTSEAITITNTGKSALTGLNITSNNENFTVAVADNATTIAANGGTATFTVTMAPNATGAQTATITIKSDNADDLTFTAKGAVAKEGTTAAVFNDETLAGWTKGGNTSYNSSENAAYFYYSTNTLTSPKLTFVADDFLAVKAKMASGYGYVTVKGSADGTSFTEIKKLDSSVLNQTDYTTCIVSGISTDYKYIQLDGYYCYVEQIAGLTYAPVLQVKKGEEVVTSPAALAFGEQSAEATATYSFANVGAGTLNISNVAVENGENSHYTTNWTENVAAPFDLVITQPYDAADAGAKSATITVTTDDGNFVFNVTGTTLAADAPQLGVTFGGEAVVDGDAAAFGRLKANAKKTYTITNTATGTLTGTIATSDNTQFTVSATEFSLTAGQSTTFDVEFVYAEPWGNKAATITIHPTNDGLSDITINATGTAIDPATWTEDFSGNTMPEGWNVSGNSEKWTFDNGVAKSSYSSTKGYLETPLLTLAADDVLSFQAKSTYAGTVTIKIYKKVGSGNWENSAFKTISLTSADNGIWKDYTIEGLEAGNYKFRFENEDYELKNFEGGKLCANDPTIAVFSDAEATQAVTTGTAKDFGWTKEAATATYYIKNAGTGTLTISNISEVEGFTAATAGDVMTIAAGADPLALTFTMTNAAEGAKSGTITLTTDGGNFEIPVKGFVYGDKNFVDFTADGAKWPAGWTHGNWTISNGAATCSSSSDNTIETKSLTVAANEKLYVDIKGNNGYGTKVLSYTYSADNGATWSDAFALVEQVTSYTKVEDQIATIENIADASAERTVLVRFTGQGVGIRRIYGFTAVLEPVMTTTAADINFGMQTAESAEQTFTITNEGTATLEGLSVTLGKTGDAAEYSVALYDGENAFEGTTLEAGKSITAKVKQLFDLNKLGAKSDVLTIAATGQTPVAINLTGATRDGSKLFVDFEDGNIPADWTKNTWSVTTSSGNKVAYAGFTASALVTSPLTVAENEVLTFKAGRQYSSYEPTLKVRYTTDGGVTWSEYQDFAAQVTSTNFETISLNGVPAGTAVVEIYGRYFYLDEISGFAATTAPMINVTEGANAVANGDTKDFGSTNENGVATYTIKNTGNAVLSATLTGNGVSVSPASVELAAGESTDVTVTMACEAPYGEKNATLTITSESWIGDMTLNFKANMLDVTAFKPALDAQPAGWYNGGWTISGGVATAAAASDLITEKLEVKGTDEKLTYEAKYNSQFTKSLTVSYSTDRVNWTDVVITEDLTNAYKPFELTGLAAGNYYVKFSGAYVSVQNLMGWHTTEAPEHDLYFASIDTPDGTYVPGSTYAATVKVANLRAATETVKAELYIKNEKAGELAEEKVIAVNATETITLMGTVPEEGKHIVYVKVYNDDINIQTAEVTITSEHVRMLAVTAFARRMEAEEPEVIEANSENKFTAKFDVTVENTGTTALNNPTAKVFLGETEVGTATADATIPVGESAVITVTAADVPAGEGGEKSFTTAAYLEDRAFTYETPVVITVKAAAPKFALYDGTAAVENNTAVDFGISETVVSKVYTIKNEGNAPLTINSITAPEGFTATPALTDENKVIAIDGSFELTISTTAAYGKKQGDVVINYQVDATNNADFTLAVKGRHVPEGTWVETFEGDEMPAGWMNSGSWKVSLDNTVYSYDATSTLITPRLSAKNAQALTFEVVKNDNDAELKVEISNDRQNWTVLNDITSTVGEKTITATATASYYVRFTGKYIYLDNFVGWKKAVVEHDLLINSFNIPAEATVNNKMEATIHVKELVGKAETVKATLYVDGTAIATETKDVTANSMGYFTLSFTPHAATDGAVKAYLEISIPETDFMLKTAEQDFTINAESGEYQTLTGIVKDGNSQPVEGADITVTATKSDGTEVIYTATTGADGKFSVNIYQTTLNYTVKAVKDDLNKEVEVANFTDEIEIILGNTVGIRAILREKGMDGNVYTLQGVRVENPVKGQLYIVNGKKIVMK